ncbi:MAG TPA: T9SS type A sorting domain-containing protein [Flavobacteriia bacterium]|nr:T9SS type A sorting domain-containing protein [Flavobacteriia bacterium]
MKKFYFLLVAIFVTTISFAQVTELYFSKYGEGSSNNKFVEIYNGTNADISLDGYGIGTASNGTTDGNYEYWISFPAGSVIAAGDVFVIAHTSADAIILGNADMTYQYMSNGDDGWGLTKGGTFNDANQNGTVDAGEMTGFQVIDWLGDWGADPGSGWEVSGVANATQNHTLIRKASVCGPNASWDDARGYDAASGTTSDAASEWIVNPIDSGWDLLGSYVGCQTDPTLAITYPADGSTISATTSVDVAFSVDNFTIGNPGDQGVDGHVHYSTDNGANWSMHYSTNPITIAVTPGNTYTVMLKLVDNSHSDLTPPVEAQTTFTVDLPCDLQLDFNPTATCNGTTMYDIDIPFTGGGTSNYTLTTNSGTIGGDDPSTMATGTITITGAAAGTDVVFTAVGDQATSSCSITRNVSSPACGTVTCAPVGSVIITEIMQNPATPINDGDGEWFEIYNTTANPIDLQGWEFVDDNSTTEGFTVTSSLIIPANGYLLFARSADSALNGGLPTPDYIYAGLYLGNGTDGIIIRCAANDIDSVVWDNGTTFPDPNGASMVLDPTKLDATSNDDGANWHEETVNTYGTGQFGTPGQPNSPAASIANNELEGFNVYPNPAKDQIFISTTNGNSKTIELFSVIGKRVYANKTTANSAVVNVSNLNAGLYILKVSDGTATSIEKVVVK